ncbi:MAG: YceI family protein [Planctomycetota bacterium]
MAVSNKILQWGGLLALVAFAGSGVVTWGLVKDRLDITIATAPDENQVDPIALLRDEVAVLRTDLGLLASAITRNFELLAAAGEESSAGVEASIVERLDRLEASLRAPNSIEQEQRQILAELRGALLELGTANLVAKRTEGAVPSPTTDEAWSATPPGALTQEIPAGREPAPPSATPAPTPTVAASPVAAPVRKKKGFLAFELPASGFEFDRRQRFEIISSLSRVGFDAKSTLHDFSGVTSQVRGQLVMNLARSTSDCTGTIVVDAASLRTGVEGRDEGMFEHLDTARYPNLEFELRELVATETDANALKVRGTLKGTLRIRGKEREVAMPVDLSVDDSRRVLIAGEMPLDMNDYGVPVPNQAGLIKVEPVVKVWVSLRARSVGAAAEN